MDDLFTPDSAPPVRPRPARPCTQAQFAIETLGLPADWRATSCKVVGDVKAPIGIQIEGGVYRHTMQRGPRKGKPDWRKPEPGSVVVVTVGEAQFNAWRQQWEAETGLCSKCNGTGIVFAGWHHINGTKMRPCRVCAGTGDRPAAPAVAAE